MPTYKGPEWVIDYASNPADTASSGSVLYLHIWSDQVPSNLEVKTRDVAFDLDGISNVTINGLNSGGSSMKLFAASVYTNALSTNDTIENITAEYLSSYDRTGVANINNSNSDFSTPEAPINGYGEPYSGIDLMGVNDQLLNSVVEYCAGNGVTVSNSFDRVADCNIHDVDAMATDNAGVYVSPGFDIQPSATINLGTVVHDLGTGTVDTALADAIINAGYVFSSTASTTVTPQTPVDHAAVTDWIIDQAPWQFEVTAQKDQQLSVTNLHVSLRAGTDILHNVIADSGRSLIVHRQGNDVTIGWNDLSFASLQTDDCGATYTFGKFDAASTIEYNYVHDSVGIDYSNALASGIASANLTSMDHVSAGIYLDNGSGGFTVEYNVVYNVNITMLVNPPGGYQNEPVAQPIVVAQNTFDPHVTGGHCFASSNTTNLSTWAFTNNLLECPKASIYDNPPDKYGGSPVGSSASNADASDTTPITDSYNAFTTPTGNATGALVANQPIPIIGSNWGVSGTAAFSSITQSSDAISSEPVVSGSDLKPFDPIYDSASEKPYTYWTLTTSYVGGKPVFDFTGAGFLELGDANNSIANYTLTLTVSQSAYVYVLVDLREFGDSTHSATLPTFSMATSDQGVIVASSVPYLNYEVYRSNTRLSAGDVYTIRMVRSNAASAFLAVLAQYA